jgi:hypothetical protein
MFQQYMPHRLKAMWRLRQEECIHKTNTFVLIVFASSTKTLRISGFLVEKQWIRN